MIATSLFSLLLLAAPRAAHQPAAGLDALADADDSSSSSSDDSSSEDDELDFGDDLDLKSLDFSDEEDQSEQAPAEPEKPPALDEEEEEPDIDEYGGDESVEQDVFQFDEEEEEEVPIGGPGQDTARIYRSFMEQMEDLGPDEEIISWEQYLEKYPNSLFKDRIQRRIEELSAELYDERVSGTEDLVKVVDAGQREIGLTAPLVLDSIDPRNRFRVGFGMGYPEYLNLVALYEHQFVRSFSVAGGIQHRLTGWSIEAQPHWAFVKSARTNTIVSLLGDLRLNTDPLYPAFRPGIGAGKRFLLAGDHPLDLQLQLGADLEFGSPFSYRYVGGLGFSYQPSETVRFFMETDGELRVLHEDLDHKPSTPDQALAFWFDELTFGITFLVKGKYHATLGAAAPYSAKYWGYHFGYVSGVMDAYY